MPLHDGTTRRYSWREISMGSWSWLTLKTCQQRGDKYDNHKEPTLRSRKQEKYARESLELLA